MKIRQTIIVGIAAAGGFLFAINSVWAQEQLDGNTPQKIENVVKVQRSAEWYRAQESLWRAKVEKNPKNKEAWNNYYRAARYGGWENFLKVNQYPTYRLIDRNGNLLDVNADPRNLDAFENLIKAL